MTLFDPIAFLRKLARNLRETGQHKEAQWIEEINLAYNARLPLSAGTRGKLVDLIDKLKGSGASTEAVSLSEFLRIIDGGQQPVDKEPTQPEDKDWPDDDKGLLVSRNGPDGLVYYGIVVGSKDDMWRVKWDEESEPLLYRRSAEIEVVELRLGDAVRIVNTGEEGAITTITPPQNGLRRVGVKVGQHLKYLQESSVRPIGVPVDVDTARWWLRINGAKLRCAYLYDERSQLAAFRADLKPHQVFVAHRVVIEEPHRFLLADEVGLGKTIEAGMIIKELKARKKIQRILCIVPKNLVNQWVLEMREKFNETFTPLRREVMQQLREEHPGANPWETRDSFICSHQFIISDDERQELALDAPWDLVIVDEAHHVRRTEDLHGDIRTTHLYQFLAKLAPKCKHLLLLTATPLQLSRVELYSLVDLLDEALFYDEADFDAHCESLAGLNMLAEKANDFGALTKQEQDRLVDQTHELITREHLWKGTKDELRKLLLETGNDRRQFMEILSGAHRLSEVMIRNKRRWVKGFPQRRVKIVQVTLSAEEKAAYDYVSEYVRTGYRSSGMHGGNARFLAVTFKRLLTSSSYALKRSFEKRLERIKQQPPPATASGEDGIEDGTPIADALTDEFGRTFLKSVQAEVNELKKMIAMLNVIKSDTKVRFLLKELRALLKKNPREKILIFTQFIETLEYVKGVLEGDGVSVVPFHGKMSEDAKEKSVASFRDAAGANVMISTESGGEGRNLQVARVMFNYDLPWNPMRIEQRIGRIDRIGQKASEILIFNLSIKGTIEERILDVLQHRVRIFEDTVGGLEPLLGELERELEPILMEPDDGQRFDEFAKKWEHVMRKAREDEAKDKLADFLTNFRSFRPAEVDDILKATPAFTYQHIKDFMRVAFKVYNVRPSSQKEKHVYFVPLSNEFLELVGKLPLGMAKKFRATYDPETAKAIGNQIEFLAVGHPVIDTTIERVTSPRYPRTGLLCLNSLGLVSAGILFHFLMKTRVGPTVIDERVEPVFIDLEGKIDPTLTEKVANFDSKSLERLSVSNGTIPQEAASRMEGLRQKAIDHVLARWKRDLGDRESHINFRREAQRRKLERFYNRREERLIKKLEKLNERMERAQIAGGDQARIIPVWRNQAKQFTENLARIPREREGALKEFLGDIRPEPEIEPLAEAYCEL
ncbi:MAG: DEAD/DEAH box helicase family protein [Elusimicrobia bacterium]|nr:DEAD/DEAH box helicase family protein [Elusimicrobiota bacterium]